jgi:hypothetical protein
VDTVGAWTTLGTSTLLVMWTTFVMRSRQPQRVTDGLLAIGGAGVAIGGLLFLSDVSAASWLVAPIVLATLTVVHVRVLFAGGGPFRT